MTDNRNNPADTADRNITLERLENLDGYNIADGYSNVKAWKVIANGSLNIGKVRGLISSKELGRVLYLDIEVEKSESNQSKLYMIVPIGLVRFDEENQTVQVDAIDVKSFITYPRYEGSEIRPDYERLVYQYYKENSDLKLKPYVEHREKYYEDETVFNQARVHVNQTAGF